MNQTDERIAKLTAFVVVIVTFVLFRPRAVITPKTCSDRGHLSQCMFMHGLLYCCYCSLLLLLLLCVLYCDIVFMLMLYLRCYVLCVLAAKCMH